MFVTAICVLFFIKLRWPKNKSLYDKAGQIDCDLMMNILRCFWLYIRMIADAEGAMYKEST